jgi:HD superfamily phosphodiesterase
MFEIKFPDVSREKIVVLREIYKGVQRFYEGYDDWVHGLKWHINRVVECADVIAKGEHADRFLCCIAAMCHDLGRVTERKFIKENKIQKINHAMLSAKPTLDLMLPHKDIISDDGIKKIIDAILQHNLPRLATQEKTTLVLQDADRVSRYFEFDDLVVAYFDCHMKIPEPFDEKEARKLKQKLLEDFKKNEKELDIALKHLLFHGEWFYGSENVGPLNTKTAMEHFEKDFIEWQKNIAVLKEIKSQLC